MTIRSKVLLVGDNPFHNISHLSQSRARERGANPCDPEYAARLIEVAVENGADGFMFSISQTTLEILRILRDRGRLSGLRLYAIAPYAYEYVRLASQLGGIPGLAKKVGGEILTSRNASALRFGLKGVLQTNPEALLKAYVSYELSRVKAYAGKKARVETLMLHQVVTDLALALGMSWLFKAYVEFLRDLRIAPGFNTGNFAFLVNKLDEWGIDSKKTVVAAPFNRVGFQMTPSPEECEEALKRNSTLTVVAISVLASGYLTLVEAAEYLRDLPNIAGLSVGISKEKHAKETFRLIRQMLG